MRGRKKEKKSEKVMPFHVGKIAQKQIKNIFLHCTIVDGGPGIMAKMFGVFGKKSDIS